MAFIRSFKYSANEARYSVSSMTRSQSVMILAKSSSVISVPIDVSAACLTSLAISSGTLTFEKSVSFAFDFKPMCLTTFANAIFSVTIFPISGKCQPYHSRRRIAKLFNSLSKSSKRPTACMIITSTLSGENFSLNRDNVWARPNAHVCTSFSESPSMRLVMCCRIPRMTSLRGSFNTAISIPNFLLILEPKVLSSVTKLSSNPASTMFFFKNFFNDFPTVPSVSSVAASIAALVSGNLEKACRETCFVASLTL
mmetsp:Transcript_79136/g.124787  ORF Transcript_79136/g.124787 Transcript_79136/m.124787 type:complete len:254 (+) Transcript_79136:632-1393(+)